MKQRKPTGKGRYDSVERRILLRFLGRLMLATDHQISSLMEFYGEDIRIPGAAGQFEYLSHVQSYLKFAVSVVMTGQFARPLTDDGELVSILQKYGVEPESWYVPEHYASCVTDSRNSEGQRKTGKRSDRKHSETLEMRTLQSYKLL